MAGSFLQYEITSIAVSVFMRVHDVLTLCSCIPTTGTINSILRTSKRHHLNPFEHCLGTYF